MAVAEDEKTTRIGFICMTMVVLGLFLFCSKMDACQSCGKTDSTPVVCKDQFFEIDTNNSRFSQDHTCTPGARVEIVTSPPAPKPGVMCRCPVKDQSQNAPQSVPSK